MPIRKASRKANVKINAPVSAGPPREAARGGSASAFSRCFLPLAISEAYQLSYGKLARLMLPPRPHDAVGRPAVGCAGASVGSRAGPYALPSVWVPRIPLSLDVLLCISETHDAHRPERHLFHHEARIPVEPTPERAHDGTRATCAGDAEPRDTLVPDPQKTAYSRTKAGSVRVSNRSASSPFSSESPSAAARANTGDSCALARVTASSAARALGSSSIPMNSS
jgi:hypothetical protein